MNGAVGEKAAPRRQEFLTTHSEGGGGGKHVGPVR